MKTVELKNGAEEAEALVTVTIGSLHHLIETNPIAFYELVQKARDKDHKIIWGNVSSVLKSLALLSENGAMHDSIRNIVLSAAEGDGLDMALVSPIKEYKETL